MAGHLYPEVGQLEDYLEGVIDAAVDGDDLKGVLDESLLLLDDPLAGRLLEQLLGEGGARARGQGGREGCFLKIS